MKKHILLPALLAFLPALGTYSQNITADSLVSRIRNQVYNYPQEKVHVTTDKPDYFCGDTIWFRAFVTDASTHKPAAISKYLYVELTNPFDSIETRVKIMEQEGIYKGYIPLDPLFAEGDYTLTAYTAFMENAGKEFFFRKHIPVKSPFSVQSQIECTFEWQGSTLTTSASYTSRSTGEYNFCDKMSYTTCKGEEKEVKYPKAKMDFTLRGADLDKPYVLLSFGNYHKFVRLPQKAGSPFSVSFHPEGGYLVPDEECRVAVKAIDSDGLGTDVTGTVTDSRGNIVAKTSTVHRGMGVFSFTPQAGEKYKAEMHTADGRTDIFDLPEANIQAAVLRASNETDTLFITAAGNIPAGSFILIQQRGQVLATAPIAKGTVQYFEKKDFPAGVAHILLLDRYANTMSERLVFVRDRSRHSTQITPDSTAYGTRQKIQLDIQLDGYSGTEASVALSVTDNELVKEHEQLPIEAQMLLQSDIAGYIENPAYYFETDTEEADKALDILLMTQGWRRYNIPQVLLGNWSEPEIPLEIGQEISGEVKRLILGTPREGININVLSAQAGYVDATTTDSQGRFCFKGFDFPENTSFVIQAKDNNGNPLLNFDVFEYRYPENPFGTPPPAPLQQIREYTEQETMMLNSNPVMKEILLDEIVITGRRQHKPKDVYEMLASKSYDSDYIKRNNITSFDEIIWQIAGIREEGGYLYYRNSMVSFMVDGVLEQGIYENTVSLDDIKRRYNIEMMKRIDFIPPYMSACFGLRTTLGGILSFMTKDIGDATENKLPNYMKLYSPLGYQKPAEFYSPAYGTAADAPAGTDMRSTVFWAPDIKVGKDGKAHVEFFSTDMPGTTYTVKAEGVADDGSIVSGSCEIQAGM